jgi:hypothetical protein
MTGGDARSFLNKHFKNGHNIRSLVALGYGLAMMHSEAGAKVIKPQAAASPLDGFVFSFVAGKIEFI